MRVVPALSVNDARGCSLEPKNDALDPPCHVPKEWGYWAIRYRRNIPEAYVCGKAEVRLRGVALGSHIEGDLVFRRVRAEDRDSAIEVSDVHLARGNSNRQHDLMLFSGQEAECPKCVVAAGVAVASRIWFEAAQDRPENIRNIAMALRGEGGFEVRWRLCEGKIDVSSRAQAENFDANQECLIEGGPQIIDDPKCNCSAARRRYFEASLNQYVSAIRIDILDYSIGIVVEESVEQFFQLANAFVCVDDE